MKKAAVFIIIAALLAGAAGPVRAADSSDGIKPRLARLSEEERQLIYAQIDITAGEMKALVQLYAQLGVISSEEAARFTGGINAMTDRLKEENVFAPQKAARPGPGFT